MHDFPVRDCSQEQNESASFSFIVRQYSSCLDGLLALEVVCAISRALEWILTSLKKYKFGNGTSCRRIRFVIMHVVLKQIGRPHSSTVKPLLSGHLRDFPKCPLNRGCPLNRVCKICAVFVIKFQRTFR